jgi:hypothetical protein
MTWSAAALAIAIRIYHRIQASRRQLEQLQLIAGIECREHHVATSHTVLRFDEQLLLDAAS